VVQGAHRRHAAARARHALLRATPPRHAARSPRAPSARPSSCAQKAQGCKDRYPKPQAAFTHMNADGFIEYARDAADVMVVPYNPWVTLYFTEG
jgi:hypothetical protein